MKRHAAVGSPWKRKWRGPTVAVGSLVCLSLLVPVAFLLGFHNRFPSGFLAEDRLPLEISFGSHERVKRVQESFEDAYPRIDKVIGEFRVSPIKDNAEKEPTMPADSTLYTNTDATPLSKPVPSSQQDDTTSHFHFKSTVSTVYPLKKKRTIILLPKIAKAELISSIHTNKNGGEIRKIYLELPVIDVANKSCQLEFGNYCLWSIEHKEIMKDSVVKRLKDQLFVARVYYPSVAKLKAHEDLSREIKQNIHNHEKILSEAISDADLPPFSSSRDRGLLAPKVRNPSFRRYVIFTRNVLSASVTVNSTVMNSGETDNMVFHLIIDKQNYYAMKYWFTRYSFKEAFIHIINIDKKVHLRSLSFPQLSLSQEFWITMQNTNKSLTAQMKTEYLSVFGHSHFLLPEIFRNLKKVVVLDDDLVVQQDLFSLWNMDMGGKVVGAVESCGVTLSQLKSYLPIRSYDPDSCVWMSGLNVVDLEKWKEHHVTGIYNKVMSKVKSTSEESWAASTLPASLLTFQNLVHPLDSSWTLSGLGYNYRISAADVRAAATLYYNGNMKPWLELGIISYRKHWKKYLKQGDRFMMVVM